MNANINALLALVEEHAVELARLRAENARLKATPFGSHDCPACGRSTSHVCAR
jgi:hypothetical protein